MTRRLPLLIELGCEELPVKALPGLAAAFRDGLLAGLDKRGIGFEGARVLYTPRRLAVVIDAVAVRQPDQASEVLGPYVNIALDGDGHPTRALLGFAQKAGVEWQALDRGRDAKGERFVHRSVRTGADTASLLPELLDETIKALPIPKPMRWGDHEHEFARPVHWLVLLLGDEVVPARLLGVVGGRDSRGHRFHRPGEIRIDSPARYESQLEAAWVLADADRRRARIERQVREQAQAGGGEPRLDPGILEEVTCLTEWPVAIACGFERDFLRVPQEALILTMETNQKFFPVLDAQGRLTERFIGVANIESADPAQVRQGYERVIRPRFADARFFYDEDLRQGLASMADGLGQVTYQARLGSIADKVARVAALAEIIAGHLGVDPTLARRAAALAKADLQSRMVNEFPELQGVAGRYYAAAQGENAEVAAAMDEFYMPRFAGDAIAPSPLGQVLAIAERLDTLAGGFAAGLKPTGNKDPFALRRNALGLARTVIEAGIELDLAALLKQAGQAVAHAGPPQDDELFEFILDRLRGYYEQRSDYDATRFEAVAAVRPASLLDFDRRLAALREFASSEDGQALAAANKRCGNLLRKAIEGGEAIPQQVDAGRFEHDAERALAAALTEAEADGAALVEQGRYVDALARLARLRPAVDAFFEGVMVMADDRAVRGNRLALLRRLHSGFLGIADISRLAQS